MSTSLQDVASAAVVAAGLYPVTRTSSVNGPTVDLGGDGPCFAVLQVGVLAAGTQVDSWIEESAAGSSWATIPGAAFAAATAGSSVQVIRFNRTARYVRWACAISGDTPSAVLAVLIGEQKKTL